MLRIGLYSEDAKLQQILSSVLGKDFQVLLEATETGINRLLAAGGCDVMILAIHLKTSPIESRSANSNLRRQPVALKTKDGDCARMVPVFGQT